MTVINAILVVVFVITQIIYFLSMLIDVYFFTRPVNAVDLTKIDDLTEADYPPIICFYPVLKELEGTMRTTLTSLAKLDYPADKFKIIAIPNDNDLPTVASLERLRQEFPFLELIAVPPTSDPTWQCVWDNWETNKNAYWYHNGDRAGDRALPPKKTRQLIYSFYNVMAERGDEKDLILSYIDADSSPPANLFKAAAVGFKSFDVLQATNVAGNLLHTMPASWFGFDHLTWDANKYRHLTANGKQPFWMLGKGLFFKAKDILDFGGFHPWITIEDPEVGLRLWAHGKTLGVIDSPLIEEVPETLSIGIRQRERWMAGFFQTLDVPLRELGLNRVDRIKAWLNFLPCLSLSTNAIGIPLGIWALVVWLAGTSPLPAWTLPLVLVNFALLLLAMTNLYIGAWKMSANVLPKLSQRIWYIIRVNPISLIIFWCIWIIPLWKGWRMYRKNTGLVWDRTEKINANAKLVRARV